MNVDFEKACPLMAFQKGISISVFQNSGEQEFASNWTGHVRRKSKQSPVPNSKDVIGIACDFWNRWHPHLRCPYCKTRCCPIIPWCCLAWVDLRHVHTRTTQIDSLSAFQVQG